MIDPLLSYSPMSGGLRLLSTTFLTGGAALFANRAAISSPGITNRSFDQWMQKVGGINEDTAMIEPDISVDQAQPVEESLSLSTQDSDNEPKDKNNSSQGDVNQLLTPVVQWLVVDNATEPIAPTNIVATTLASSVSKAIQPQVAAKRGPTIIPSQQAEVGRVVADPKMQNLPPSSLAATPTMSTASPETQLGEMSRRLASDAGERTGMSRGGDSRFSLFFNQLHGESAVQTPHTTLPPTHAPAQTVRYDMLAMANQVANQPTEGIQSSAPDKLSFSYLLKGGMEGINSKTATQMITPGRTLSSSEAEFASHLVDELGRFRVISRPGMNEQIRMTLQPKELGELNVHLRIDDDQRVHITIMAENESAREVIHRQLPQLKEALLGQNVLFGEVNINLSSQQGGNQQENCPSQPFDHQARRASSARGRDGTLPEEMSEVQNRQKLYVRQATEGRVSVLV